MKRTKIDTMKEKTFEELIDEELKVGEQVYFEQVFKLLQQVREATIEECMKIAAKGYHWAPIFKKIEKLPTDRIKIEQ